MQEIRTLKETTKWIFDTMRYAYAKGEHVKIDDLRELQEKITIYTTRRTTSMESKNNWMQCTKSIGHILKSCK